MKDHDCSRWQVSDDHFEVAIRLGVWMSDVNHCCFAWLTRDFGRCFRVHDRVKRVLARNAVFIGAARKPDSHS